MSIEDYRKQLENKQLAIDELKQQNLLLHEDLTDMMGDTTQKSQMKGAAKMFATVCNKVIDDSAVRRAFENWKADYEVNKVMENAFNKVLEMNHKHVCARFESGARLLTTVINSHTRRAFGDIFNCEKPLFSQGIRSTTPKFSHTHNIMGQMDYSASLQDSSVFINNNHERYTNIKARRKANKSADSNTFLF